MSLKKISSLLLSGTILFALASCGEKPKEVQTYNISPVVQKATYDNSSTTLTLSSGCNLVLSSSVSPSIDLDVNQMLTNFGYTSSQITKSSSLKQAGLNLVLALKDDTETSLISSLGELDKTSYDHIDGYNLLISGNTIALIGKDAKALFYATKTLNLILHQVKANKYALYNVIISDYSNTQYRGIVEGFYGEPWTNEDRINLIKYGSNYKLNSYVFAPKDDPYHSEKWKTLYPQEDLNKLKEVVKVSHDNNVEFTWSIHPFLKDRFKAPGFSPVSYDDKGRPKYNPDYDPNVKNDKSKAKYLYEAEETEEQFNADFKLLTAKFDQLYSIGVRSFAVGADDFSAPEGWNSSATWDPVNFHGKIMNKLIEWKNTKSDKDKIHLTFCPTVYTSMYLGWGAKYLNNLGKTIPSEVSIQWTGDWVVGGLTQNGINDFVRELNKEVTEVAKQHKPLFWLNWPTTDYAFDSVVIGNATNVLENGAKDLLGIQVNPMSYAEASKVGIFQVLDFAWNSNGFDPIKSHANAITSLDSNVTDSLLHVSNYLSSTYRGHWEMAESDNFAKEFKNIEIALDSLKETIFDHGSRNNKYDSNFKALYSSAALILKSELNALKVSCEKFLSDDNKNLRLQKELKPYVEGLSLLAEIYVSELELTDSFVSGKLPSDLASKIESVEAKVKTLKDIKVNKKPSDPRETNISVKPGAKYLHPGAMKLLDFLKSL